MTDSDFSKNDISVLNSLAAHYTSMGKTDEGLALLKLSETLSANQPETRRLRVKSQYKAGNMKAAVAEVLAAVKHNQVGSDRALFAYVLLAARYVREANKLLFASQK